MPSCVKLVGLSLEVFTCSMAEEDCTVAGGLGWNIVLTQDFGTSLLHGSQGCGLCVHPRSANLCCWLCLRRIIAVFGYRLSGDEQKLFCFLLVGLFFGFFYSFFEF